MAFGSSFSLIISKMPLGPFSMRSDSIEYTFSASATFFSPRCLARSPRILAQVMPMSCSRNVTMLLSDKSFGISTPTSPSPPSSQLMNPLSKCPGKLSKNWEKPLPSPLSKLPARLIPS